MPLALPLLLRSPRQYGRKGGPPSRRSDAVGAVHWPNQSRYPTIRAIEDGCRTSGYDATSPWSTNRDTGSTARSTLGSRGGPRLRPGSSSRLAVRSAFDHLRKVAALGQPGGLDAGPCHPRRRRSSRPGRKVPVEDLLRPGPLRGPDGKYANSRSVSRPSSWQARGANVGVQLGYRLLLVLGSSPVLPFRRGLSC